MRVSTFQMYNRSLQSLLDNQTALSQLQTQMSTGKKINAAADDPVGLSQAFSLHVSLDTFKQFQANNQSAQSRLSLEESALSHAQSVLQQIYLLGVSANKSSLQPADRIAIATEIDVRLSELVSLANEKLPTGEYLFGGHVLSQPPVSQDNAGNFVYQGDNGQIRLQIGPSIEMGIQDPGDTVFFRVPLQDYAPQVTRGITAITGNPSTFPVTAGTLPVLGAGNLLLNGEGVRAALVTDDTVSSTDRAGSGIAIAAAINAGTAAHAVSAEVQPTVLNLGAYTPGNALSGEQLSINGVAVDTLGDNTEAGLLTAVNALSGTTGVTAVNDAGNIVFTAVDGRNIQVRTDGSSVTSAFAGFDLTGGAVLDQVQRAAVVLRSPLSVAIGGGNPAAAGLVAGVTHAGSIPANLTVSSVKMVANPSETVHPFRLVFDNPPTHFSVVSTTDSNAYYTGPAPYPDELGETVTYDGSSSDSEYVAGMTIQVNGIQYVLTGNPAAGDTWVLGVESQGFGDIFSTVQGLSQGIRSAETASELDYQIGVAIANIQSATDVLAALQADVGARLNVLAAEFELNEDFTLSTTTTLVKIQHMDTGDYERVISLFQLYTLTLEIAQKTFVSLQGLSLFNYMR